MREEAAQKQWGRQANNWLGTRVGCFKCQYFWKFLLLQVFLIFLLNWTHLPLPDSRLLLEVFIGFHNFDNGGINILAITSRRENLEINLAPLLSLSQYLPTWSPSCYVACWNRRRYEKTADQPWTEIVKHGRTKARERERIVSIGVG